MDKVRDKVINPRLEGVGKLEDLDWKDRKLTGRLLLDGLEHEPLELACEEISLAPDGSSVTVGKFTANKKFAQTALDRYLAGKPIHVPEGAPRLAVSGLAKLLG